MARTGDTQARDQLEKLAQALPNLADVFLNVVEENEGDGREQYKGFIEVLRRDAEAVSYTHLPLPTTPYV